jgi:hypothetical protein
MLNFERYVFVLLVFSFGSSSLSSTTCDDSSNLCCSLNGVYSADSGCTCTAPWSGQNCSTLNFLPAKPFPQGFGTSPNHTTWGGNLLYSDLDNLYHLFVAEMVNDCGLVTWETNSRCTHAVSSTPDGPYSFVDVAVDVWCHNPQIVPYESGFALFHIGSGQNGNPINCSSSKLIQSDGNGNGDEGEGERGLVQTISNAGSGSSLHLSNSLYGPWVPVTENAPPSCNNPSPVRHPNSTWFLLCDSTTLYRLENNGRGGGATGAPIGNWTVVSQLIPDGNAVKGDYEDAFLFFDKSQPNPGWHVLFHVWTTLTNITDCVNTTVSGLAFSQDGLEWHFSQEQPYGSEVIFSDGSSMIAPTLERPKLFFDSSNNPTHLVNGACGGASSCLPHWCSRCKQLFWDFTLIRPVAL